MSPRGTRPTRPYRWPKHAAEYRVNAEQAAKQIDELAQKIAELGQTEFYLRREMIADIRYLAACIQLWMSKAAQGPEQE